MHEEYFKCLVDMVCKSDTPKDLSYIRLLRHLHSIPFVYLDFVPRDQNRGEDGISLRRRLGYDSYDPCSVLEMMIALAERCERDIMDDPNIGDRTAQWFWEMITNLGLGGMTDTRYDPDYIDDVIHRFLYREYEPDGKGGLFRVRGCNCDLRDVEIWYQLCWYLDSIT